MHDEAPPHFTRQVRNNNNYPDEWIGRGGPVAWPPWFPRLEFARFLSIDDI